MKLESRTLAKAADKHLPSDHVPVGMKIYPVALAQVNSCRVQPWVARHPLFGLRLKQLWEARSRQKTLP
eukprot:11158033-Lingulodinium_polyedra.AAC.1